MTKPWWTRALLGRTAVSNPIGSDIDDAPDPQFEAQWRSVIKKRLFPVLAIMALWVVALEGRLVWVQAIDHETWARKAIDQQEDTEPIYPHRGDVLDRHGRLLAYSIISYDVRVNPKELAKTNVKPADLAHDVCAALANCSADEVALLTGKFSQPKLVDFVVRHASDMTFDSVAEMEGLVARYEHAKKPIRNFLELRPQDVRYYPNNSLAAQVIGPTRIEEPKKGTKSTTVVGLNGVEKLFNEQLRGLPGKQLKQVDGRNEEILTTVLQPPTPGVTLELTIDSEIQDIVERALRAGIERAGAAYASAIVLDSATGEVLAMASLPDYNLNLPGSVREAERNHATQDLNEPGSTFKIVTLSAALNEGIVSPNTLIPTDGGRFMIEGRSKPITEDKGHNYGTLTVEGVLVRSSNIGAAKIGLQMGSDLMLHYARAFGITPPVQPPPGSEQHRSEFYSASFGGITLQKGLLSRPALATVSYGYGVTASPLQMVSAMNVFATGGLLMRPHLIHAIVENGVRRVQDPEVSGRVIKPETAAAMVTMLEDVVDDPAGTGGMAKMSRYRVAGKTGTTKKVTKAGYSENSYRVSFVGFAPSRQPRFTIIVVVDEPTKLPAYGGAVAAPVFKEIAEKSLNYIGAAPSVNPPPAVILSEERPAVRPSRPESAPMFVNAGGAATMPDLTGLTLKDALFRMPPGLTMSIEGDGPVVTSQFPAAGEPLGAPGEGSMINRGVLRLQRAPAKPGGIIR